MHTFHHLFPFNHLVGRRCGHREFRRLWDQCKQSDAIKGVIHPFPLIILNVVSLKGGDLVAALQFLHDEGDIVYIHQPDVCHVVITRPLLLADVLNLIMLATLAGDGGIVSKSRLPSIWGIYPRGINSAFFLICTDLHLSIFKLFFDMNLKSFIPPWKCSWRSLMLPMNCGYEEMGDFGVISSNSFQSKGQRV